MERWACDGGRRSAAQRGWMCVAISRALQLYLRLLYEYGCYGASDTLAGSVCEASRAAQEGLLSRCSILPPSPSTRSRCGDAW